MGPWAKKSLILKKTDSTWKYPDHKKPNGYQFPLSVTMQKHNT